MERAAQPISREGGIASLRGVTREYGKGPTLVQALRGVTIEFPPRELVVLLGPSGSGKTTLLNIIGGLELPTRGAVEVDGTRVDGLSARALTEYRRLKTGFIFQFFNLLPSLTALENVEIAARLVENPMSAADVLRDVGLSERVHHFPSELSGGEQQRVAIARAIVKRPPILLCDEPTGELDEENGRKVLAILQKMKRDFGTTVLLVTHNNAIALMADRVVRMHSGNIACVEVNPAPAAPENLRW